MDITNLGTYASIDALWQAHPEGGKEGDYCTIGSVKHRWNKYDCIWENSETVTSSDAHKIESADDLHVQNDLIVGGKIKGDIELVDLKGGAAVKEQADKAAEEAASAKSSAEEAKQYASGVNEALQDIIGMGDLPEGTAALAVSTAGEVSQLSQQVENIYGGVTHESNEYNVNTGWADSSSTDELLDTPISQGTKVIITASSSSYADDDYADYSSLRLRINGTLTMLQIAKGGQLVYTATEQITKIGVYANWSKAGKVKITAEEESSFSIKTTQVKNNDGESVDELLSDIKEEMANIESVVYDGEFTKEIDCASGVQTLELFSGSIPQRTMLKISLTFADTTNSYGRLVINGVRKSISYIGGEYSFVAEENITSIGLYCNLSAAGTANCVVSTYGQIASIKNELDIKTDLSFLFNPTFPNANSCIVAKSGGGYEVKTNASYTNLSTTDLIPINLLKGCTLHALSNGYGSTYSVAVYNDKKEIIGAVKGYDVSVDTIIESYANCAYLRLGRYNLYGSFSIENHLNEKLPMYRMMYFNNIICCGDSVTEGVIVEGKSKSTTHTETNQLYSYPTYLKKMFPNINVVNKGKGGITPKGWYTQASYYQSVDFANYDLAIIELGTNGSFIADEINTDNTDANAYKKIVDGIRQQNADITIVLVINAHVTNYATWQTILGQCAEDNNCLIVDLQRGNRYAYLNDAKYHGWGSAVLDITHYNRRGYYWLAYSIANCIGEQIKDTYPE